MRNLIQISQLLDLSPAEKSEVMRELASHFYEARDELMASGMSEADAETEAAQRFGAPEDVAARLSSVHNSSTLKSALLAALPFAGAALVMLSRIFAMNALSTALTVVFAACMLAGSVREFLCGRRPIWLASWAAASVIGLRGAVALAMYPEASQSAGSIQVFTVTFFGVVLPVAGLWRVVKWRYLALVLGVIQTISSLVMQYAVSHPHPMSFMPVFVLGWLSKDILLTVFALVVFLAHPYGNLARTMLFLFTVLTLEVAVPSGFAPYRGAGLALTIGIVVAYCISSNRLGKFMLLAVGAAIQSSAYAVSRIMNHPKMGSDFSTVQVLTAMAISSFIGLVFWLLIPVAYERLKRNRTRPPVATE